MAGAKGASRKLATGVYADNIGMVAQLMVRGRRVEKRFAKGTSLKVVKDWRAAEIVRLKAKMTTGGAGTLQADIDRYLQTVTTMPSYQTRATDLRRWVEALGPTRRRDTLTAVELDVIMQTWLALGAAPVTVRHRRTALMRLFNVLDGKAAPNVVRQSQRPPDPPVEARGIDYATVADILDEVRDPRTRARLALLAYAGLPPRVLGQITRADVDFDAALLRAPGRRKGQGAAGNWRPLSQPAVNAFRELDRCHAWGPFSRQDSYNTFQRAVDRVNRARQYRGLAALPHLRPYDLRHSFASRIYAVTRDIATVSRLLGHAPNSTIARRYAMTAHHEVDVAAVTEFGELIAPVKPPENIM